MSNVNFVVYDSGGNITQSGHCSEESVQLQATPPLNVLEGIGDYSLNYVLDGNICEYTSAELQAKNSLTEGWVWQMPERITVDMRDLATAQSQAWDKVKVARDLKSSTPFTCDGSVYDANLINISGAVQLATLAQITSAPYSVDWTLYDNTVKTLDAAGIIAVGTALGLIINNAYDTARTLRAAIQACTTNTEADAITWPTA